MASRSQPTGSKNFPRLADALEPEAVTEEITDEVGFLIDDEEGQMVETHPLLSSADFSAVVISDEDGLIELAAGATDPEIISAVSKMASFHMSEALEELGLGDLEGWCAVGPDQTWYFDVRGNGITTAIGRHKRNPTGSLHKFLGST